MRLFYSPHTEIIAGNVNIVGRWKNVRMRSTYKTCIKCAVYGVDVHTERRGRMRKERMANYVLRANKLMSSGNPEETKKCFPTA